MKTTTKTMKAIAIDGYSTTEKVKIRELSLPILQDNEVQIEVKYAGVNPVDWKMKEGVLKDRVVSEFPLILGIDASGIITAIGKNVKEFKVGDEVFVMCKRDTWKWGTYAEVVYADWQQVAKKPKNITFAAAAALPLSSLTAWQGLFDGGNLKKGETVLIHGGAGGVGCMAIQFAKYIGAYVITTVAREHHHYVKEYGADLVIDHNKEKFEGMIKSEFPSGVDLVLDTIGGEVYKRSMQVIKNKGCLVSFLGECESSTPPNEIRCVNILTQPNGKQLQKIAGLIEQGTILVPKIEELLLERAQEALDKIRTHHVWGKIVLKVD